MFEAELSPIALQISRLKWDTFSGNTYKGEAHKIHLGRAKKTLYAWLRKCAKEVECEWDLFPYVVRGEFGEKTGRFHWHSLLGRIHPSDAGPRKRRTRRMILKHHWEDIRGNGMARIRDYDTSLEGVSYVLKRIDSDWTPNRGESWDLNQANSYELRKFNEETSCILVAPCVWVQLARMSRNRRTLPARAFKIARS